jgi:hypothetical protein
MGNFSSPLRTPAFRHSTFDTPMDAGTRGAGAFLAYAP